jgi:phosphate transport system ATP-binding protein
VSDRCVFLLSGQIVEHGQTKSLFAAPKDSRTADYVAGHFG